VRAAKEQLNPDATAIFVAAQYAASAIEEAIEAEIPLIVAVAEHVPLHDVMRVSHVS
jgi:succinyl-CoA synthetase alpha subunit